MNSFAALTLDSDDEETPKVSTNKKTGNTAKAAPKPKPAPRIIPGMNKPKAPAAAAAAAPAAASDAGFAVVGEDPTHAKVNDRGGRNREKYHGHSQPKGATPNDRRAHRDRHDYDRTGRGGGKEGSRGGRGPGGWGSHSEEAQRAEKNPEAAVEEATGADEADDDEAPAAEEVGPTVFGLDEFMARRNAERASSDILGAAKERTVEVDSNLKALARKENETQTETAKGSRKTQRSKTTMDVQLRFASGEESAPRERPQGGRGRGGDRAGGRGGRGDRDGGRAPRESRGPSAKLNSADFPAL